VIAEKQMRLITWQSIRAGKLLGFATVQLPIGLTIHDCPVLIGDAGVWASVPSMLEVDREGRARIGADGQRIYHAVLEWRTKRLRDAFSTRVVALVRQAHPNDLDGLE
jgi:DNA-binding cell septation regulator SpoVG